MRTALLLGKFAPLHRGHQQLIETALSENDRVLAMIYHAPDVTPIPLPVRAGWIRALYPQVEIIEAWDGPLQVSHAPEIQRQHEDYILGRLGGRRVDAFYSSEFYGEHVSRALGAVDRRIDPERAQIPISATAIRAAPYQHREFLAPLVYRDLIARVVFLGAPSTGKSTLAAALAQRHKTCWMPEYGREYWEAHQYQRRLSPARLVEIAESHREREDRLAEQANRFLFVDTDASTTRHFARHYHGSAPPRLNRLAGECAQRYDLFFLCEDDIPYADTWDRSGPANRRLMQAQVKADLALRKLPYLALRGPLERRMAQVDRVLARFAKYRSVMEHCPQPR
jgi:NadR type nicotinamide-nucleotide adenylyltransferase